MIPIDANELEVDKRYYIEKNDDPEKYEYGTFQQYYEGEPTFIAVVTRDGLSLGGSEIAYSPEEYSFFEMEEDDEEVYNNNNSNYNNNNNNNNSNNNNYSVPSEPRTPPPNTRKRKRNGLPNNRNRFRTRGVEYGGAAKRKRFAKKRTRRTRWRRSH